MENHENKKVLAVLRYKSCPYHLMSIELDTRAKAAESVSDYVNTGFEVITIVEGIELQLTTKPALVEVQDDND